MRTIALSLTLVAALSAASAAVLQGSTAPGEAEFRRAVDTLADKPLGPEGEEAAATIAAFADASQAVAVTISEAAAPWMKASATPHSEILLAAFVGGDARGQLDAGVQHDDPWSGELQVLRVYRALKAAEPKLRVPAIEQMLVDARQGKLAARLLGAATSPAAKGSKPPPHDARATQENGLVPDEATAIRIALAIWEPIYGADVIAGEKPYQATLADGVWTVTGSLPADAVGGVAELDVAQGDGQVMRISHGE